MRAYARALQSLAGSANLSLSRKAGSRFLAGFLAVSQRTLLPLQGPGHGRARAVLFLSRVSLLQAEPHPSASGALLRLCEWRHAYCEVENAPSGEWRPIARGAEVG
jgi:hypothetical protein